MFSSDLCDWGAEAVAAAAEAVGAATAGRDGRAAWDGGEVGGAAGGRDGRAAWDGR